MTSDGVSAGASFGSLPVAVTLPDGSRRRFDRAVSGAEIAAAIGPGLAKAALAMKLDGKLVDLKTRVAADAEVSLLTLRDSGRDSGREPGRELLDLLRHDAAHVMAEAVKELYPETQVTIGPAIEDGFYYDFARAEPFTPADLERIEARMHEIVSRNEEIEREVWDREAATAFFKALGEHYKAEIIAALPQGEEVSLYRQGAFVDLCRGPHLPSTGRLGHAFKLTKLAGAYWRGDHRNPMLQRIYGTAWTSQADLDAYLHRLAEAERRDHRRLGREMDLFHMQEEAVGMVFWHPKGWTLYRVLENFIRSHLEHEAYVEVRTPQLVDRKLWEESGHWEKFGEHMYTTSSEERTFALKPMNCPCHVQIFNQGLRSYRELPLRMAEFGSCHRYEPHGALHGIMRVRNFVQDDAHIFCTEEQITSETIAFCDLLRRVYRALGFDEVQVKFSDRPTVRAGSDEVWDRAEAALKSACAVAGLDYSLNPGEGAFYGPKLEFVLRDAIGRDWQCGTLQVDFVLPERLGASYVGEDGQKHVPVMLHRAILGTFERFIGILIEQYAGHLPLWLAPVQAVVATITQDGDEYAREVAARLTEAGLRVELDLDNEKINYKVRRHALAKVPLLLAIGRREAADRTVAIRRQGGQAQTGSSGEGKSQTQEILALDDAVNRLRDEARVPAA